MMIGSKGTIPERRLRPLWEAIDSRQLKTALKLASSLLSKHPDSAYLLALKALVLERTGKFDEALLLCHKAKDSKPVDDRTLRTLQTVYQRLHQLDQATECYEYACSKISNNRDLLMPLFNCYVRQYVYVKQQQTAMKLYKLFGEESFLLWAVCSILLQFHSGKVAGSMLLPLAEALLKKRVDTQGLHDVEALVLFIYILKRQQKYEAALDILTGRLGDLFSIANERLKLQGELLMLSHQYDHAAQVFEDILQTSSDDWAVFLLYLEASLKGAECGSREIGSVDDRGKLPALQGDVVERVLDRAMELVHGLQQVSTQDLKRGPFLAVVEIEKQRLLCKRMSGRENSLDEQSHVLLTAVLSYFRRFGHLMSFSSDISGSIQCLSESHKVELVVRFEEIYTQILDDNPVKMLRRKISVYQVEQLLRLKANNSNRELISSAVQIAKLYLESLALSLNLAAQESMHGEELLTLVTNLLMELFRRTQHIGYLLEATLVLEFGLFARRYNSPYKLMLINLYSMLSAVLPALEWYRTLDVKYILLETISHFILPCMLGSTCWAAMDCLLKDTLKFHDDHQRESADLTIVAYERCTYSKVLEFVEFKERLERSHIRLVAQIEEAILAIKQKADNLDDVEVVLASLDFGAKAVTWASQESILALTFNEDLQTRPWWSPAPDECYLTGSLQEAGGARSWQYVQNEDEQRKREKRWRLSVKRRCLIPRILHLLLSSVKDVPEEQSSGAQVLEELSTLMKQFVETFEIQYENVENYLVHMASAEESIKVTNVHVVEGFSIAVFWILSQVSHNYEKKSDQSFVHLFIKVMESTFNEVIKRAVIALVDDKFAGVNAATLQVVNPGSCLSNLVHLTSECLAWLGLLLQAWAKRLQPAAKKKKKTIGPLDQNDITVDSSICRNLESLRVATINELEKLKTWIANYLERPAEEEVSAFLAVLRPGSDTSVCSAGHVLELLESETSVATQLASRTPQTKQPWEAVAPLKDLVNSQRTTIADARDLCLSRLKALKSIKFGL